MGGGGLSLFLPGNPPQPGRGEPGSFRFPDLLGLQILLVFAWAASLECFCPILAFGSADRRASKNERDIGNIEALKALAAAHGLG